jgi:hypothetical protein
MEANPAEAARTADAARTRATERAPAERAGADRADRLTTDPVDRRKRANAALLELAVTRATRKS